MNTKYFLSVLLCAALISCKETQENSANTVDAENMELEDQLLLKNKSFDTILDGKKVGLYWIKNDSIKVAFTNYGARVVGLWVPDQNGEMTDVVIGMKSVADYINSSEKYFGATIGRVANRIAKGKFTLDGNLYNIPINNGENTLHGGIKGFQDVVWNTEKPNDSTIVFRRLSPHMEEGFPGNLDVKVTYSLIQDRTLQVEFEATTDKKTLVNLTNHAFFNLNGEGSGTILNHEVKINADQFTPVDPSLIPTGELQSVENTPFDFRDFHRIGERIDVEDQQLQFGKGYDHNYVLLKQDDNGLVKAATVKGDKSGIVMEVLTEEPGLQFYSGNFMQGQNPLKSGAKDEFRTAFALETQHFPDSPNQDNFPSIVLEPQDSYHSISQFKFSTIE